MLAAGLAQTARSLPTHSARCLGSGAAGASAPRRSACTGATLGGVVKAGDSNFGPGGGGATGAGATGRCATGCGVLIGAGRNVRMSTAGGADGGGSGVFFLKKLNMRKKDGRPQRGAVGAGYNARLLAL